MKKSVRTMPPQVNTRTQVTGWVAFACIVVLTLWQGSYYPIQFLLIIALILLAFVLFGKSLSVPKEAVFLFCITLLYAVSLPVFSDNLNTGLTELLRSLVFPLALILFCNFKTDKAERAIYASLMSIAVLGLLAFA